MTFKGFPQEAELPSAPKQFIQYLEEDNRPQVAEDVNYENGMGVSIGRLREDSMFDYNLSDFPIIQSEEQPVEQFSVREGSDSKGIYREEIRSHFIE